MAIGDEALADGMDLVDGNSVLANTLDDEVNKSRDYIAGRAHKVHTHALADIPALPAIAGENSAEPGEIPIYNSGGQLTSFPPTLGAHVATKAYVDGNVPAQAWGDNGDTVSPNGPRNVAATGNFVSTGGSFYSPGAYPAVSGYTVAYIDSDGRLAKGASSERYKKFISEIDPASLGDIWPALVRYQMRNGDGSWKYGYIAEHLEQSEDLRPFVVYNAEGQPDSIDFIALLMAENAQLHQQIALVTERLDALENPDV